MKPRIYASMHLCIYASMHLGIYAYIYIYKYMCIPVTPLHTCMRIYIYIYLCCILYIYIWRRDIKYPGFVKA